MDKFLKELAKYYMEFLENDFKASRPPSRRIEQSAIRDVSQVIKLRRFPTFAARISTLLQHNISSYSLPTVDKSSYVTRFTIHEVNQLLAAEPQDLAATIKEYAKNKPVENMDEIVEKITAEKEIQGDHFPIWLTEFDVVNFHTELQKMIQTKELTEGQEFYLYFNSITYKGNHYPLFYLPFTVEKEANGHFSFAFDSVLLLNKKGIQYVCEKYGEEKGKNWIPDLPSRHLYLSQFEENGELLTTVQSVMDTLCDFFDLPTLDVYEKETVRHKNDVLSLSNEVYFTLFDKSDEALLNDYEELITLLDKGSDSEAYTIFSQLANEFLFKNPLSIERDIEDAYDAQSLSDKFSYYSPIPLNKEQQEALQAIHHPKSERIVIEGPPGTGKSHTITAIIYDALLRGNSVLMVSDKQEALDVVEEKINESLDRMKVDDFVQNPVLRLGKQNNNYTKIFSQMNFQKIKTRSHVYKKEKARVEREITEILEKIQGDIHDELDSSKKVTIDEVAKLVSFEDTFHKKWQPLLAKEEFDHHIEHVETLTSLHQHVHELTSVLEHLKKEMNITFDSSQDVLLWINQLQEVSKTIEEVKEWKEKQPLLFSAEITEKNLSLLESTLTRFEDMKAPLVGHLFAGKKVKQLEEELRNEFLRSPYSSLKDEHDKMKEEVRFYKWCVKINESLQPVQGDVFYLLREDAIEQSLSFLTSLEQSAKSAVEAMKKIPETAARFGVSHTLDSMNNNTFSETSKKEMEELTYFLFNRHDINDVTSKMISGELLVDRNRLEERLVLKMTNILDESMIEFREKYRNDASEIRNQFRAKKQISKEHLRKLVKAFPCLIVGIRELGEFIPLEPHLFDLVIIDEASQVSIAQAFPAILRAKKVVVLGDSKQFSNVKSHHASTDVNQFLFKRVKDAFPDDSVTVDKLENFNIKNSILEFIKNISNYHTILKKHFRGYYELIDYSNQYFYGRALEVMKIRAKSIGEVIQFHEIPPYAKKEVRKNTNESEASFILSELDRLKQEGYKGTVGIITPFREQQKWITKLLFDSLDYDHFKQQFNLKVMTFDTCQGEERDIIYYSMVEKEKESSLNYIFPVSLENSDDTLKGQRLNVGFSRVKESARFVISKPISSFTGEAGRALKHFYRFLEETDHHEVMGKTDPKSPMEKRMYQWIIQTDFYQQNKEDIEIIPQFNMGKFLRQLDPSATIPNYRTDFLLLLRGKIMILEYDGFEYHFKSGEEVTKYNYQYLYTDSDIERQKMIESYGYPFIRLNKFILADQPITFLDKQLKKHFTTNTQVHDSLGEEMVQTFEKIENKEMKQCTKCKTMKEVKEFYDPTLKSLYGRICMVCKKK